MNDFAASNKSTGLIGQRKQISLITDEIVKSEILYRNSLYKILVNYKPLVNGNRKLSSSGLSALFDILEDICCLTSDFLLSLQATKFDLSAFIQCFLVREKEILLLYSDYCSTLPSASEVLSRLSPKDKLTATLQQIQLEGRHELPLSAELLKPFQHLFTYEMLLGRMHKSVLDMTLAKSATTTKMNEFSPIPTVKGQGTCLIIKTAMERIRMVLDRINELKRMKENRTRLKELQNGVLKTFGEFQLAEQGELLFEGDVQQYSTSNKSMPRHLILLENCLLVCKKYFSFFVVKHVLQTVNLRLDNDYVSRSASTIMAEENDVNQVQHKRTNGNNSHTISGTKASRPSEKTFRVYDVICQDHFDFVVSSAEQKSLWTRYIRNASRPVKTVCVHCTTEDSLCTEPTTTTPIHRLNGNNHNRGGSKRHWHTRPLAMTSCVMMDSTTSPIHPIRSWPPPASPQTTLQSTDATISNKSKQHTLSVKSIKCRHSPKRSNSVYYQRNKHVKPILPQRHHQMSKRPTVNYHRIGSAPQLNDSDLSDDQLTKGERRNGPNGNGMSANGFGHLCVRTESAATTCRQQKGSSLNSQNGQAHTVFVNSDKPRENSAFRLYSIDPESSPLRSVTASLPTPTKHKIPFEHNDNACSENGSTMTAEWINQHDTNSSHLRRKTDIYKIDNGHTAHVDVRSQIANA